MQMMNEVRAELFLRRLPAEVRATLTAEQESALRTAAAGRIAAAPPFDLRFSVPTPWGRYYLAVFGGPERRSTARRAADRRLRPLATTGAVLVAGGGLAAVGFMMLLGMLLASAVLDY